MSPQNSEATLLTRLRELTRPPVDAQGVGELVQLVRRLNSWQALSRAGNLLERVTWPEVSPLRTTRVAVACNFTVLSLVHYLRALLLQAGIQAEFYAAGPEYLFELLDERSELYRFRPAFTLCLLDEHWVFDELGPRWKLEDLGGACEAKTRQLQQLAGRVGEKTGSLVLVNTLPLSSRRYHALIDYASKAKLGARWRQMNANLLTWASEASNVCAVDLEVLLQDTGNAGLCDSRYAYEAAMYLSEPGVFAYARECAKVVRAGLGLSKKCLVLDLDDTLWGGTLGDVGMEGIALGPSTPGNIFVDLQEQARRLKDQGVMLTLCSKNDEANVLDMLRRHDEMRLREEDLVAWQVNWGPKVENIQTLARTCNIGLDSMVFLDDNPVERDMMSTLLPEVTVPALGEHPVTYLQTLLEGGWFNVLELSAEDTARTHMYRAQREREALLAQADSVEEYLRNLETRIRVRPLDEVNVSRLAQLSLRTNQFNLTGLRFREEELVRLMRDGSHLVLGFEVMDRCGNNGIVSSAVVEMTQEHGRSLWIIRNYVLSCRVFARGIETKVLRYILEQARQHGVSEVIGEYRPSAKNTRYASFYAEHGFVPLESGGDVQRFRHDLQTLPDATPWLELHPAQEQAA